MFAFLLALSLSIPGGTISGPDLSFTAYPADQVIADRPHGPRQPDGDGPHHPQPQLPPKR